MSKWKNRLCVMLALALMLMCMPAVRCAAAEPVPDGPAMTGDNSMLTPVIILLILSAVGIAVLIILLIKGRRK